MISQYRRVSLRLHSLLWQCCAVVVMLGGAAAQASAEDEYDQWLESFQSVDVAFRLKAAGAAEKAGQIAKAAKGYHDISTGNPSFPFTGTACP
jgi:hypothetical protein